MVLLELASSLGLRAAGERVAEQENGLLCLWAVLPLNTRENN